MSCRNFRNSCTSRSAFWIAAGVGNTCEIVFTIELIGEPETGAVARLTGLMAVTPWLTAPTRGARHVARAKIAERSNALGKHPSLF